MTPVLYMASLSFCSPACSMRGPYPYRAKFMDALDNVAYADGSFENLSCGQDGLALALQVHEDLRQQQLKWARQDPEKHIIFMSNTAPYEVPVMDVPSYMGQTMEDLLGKIKERKINFSVVCPRKLPVFVNMFEKAGGDLKV